MGKRHVFMGMFWAIVLISLVFIPLDSFGQRDPLMGRIARASGNSIVFSVGGSQYYGDLRDATVTDAIPFQDQSKIAVGVGLNKRLYRFVDIGFKGLYTQFEAGKIKNLPGTLNLYSFDTDLWQAGAYTSLDFLRLLQKSRARAWGILAHGGVGVNGYHSQAIVTLEDGSTDSFSDPAVTESIGSNIEPVFSYGIAISYRYAEHWAIGIESSVYKLAIDNLDGWSDNRSKNDQYSFTALNLSYYLAESVKKKRFRSRKERRKRRSRY